MEPTRPFSLSKSMPYSLVILLVGTLVAAAAGFWGINTHMQMREAETVVLLSDNMAQTVSQQLKLCSWSSEGQ